jgi:hypothetical protein
MSIYFKKDFKKDRKGQPVLPVNFSEDERARANEFMRTHLDELRFTEKRDGDYFGPDKGYVHIGTSQVHLTNIKPDLLQQLRGILKPHYFATDDHPTPMPIEELDAD